ncbi:hypothetical protein J4408_01100 [Candidatus Pacearchaeota archaeon]|nr:hypothetical protein [Candidatus Pacearchaeota archaeon]
MARKRAARNNSPTKLEKTIVENLVELQKVHIDLVEKFDKLASELSSLLALFEMTARSFASSPIIKETQKDHEFLDKIDRLLEQNKTIAKGLTLMEDKIKERVYGPVKTPSQQMQNIKQSMPSIGENQMQQSQTKNEDEYQPAIGSRPLPKF